MSVIVVAEFPITEQGAQLSSSGQLSQHRRDKSK